METTTNTGAATVEVAWQQFNARGALVSKRRVIAAKRLEAFIAKLAETGNLYGQVLVRDA